MLGTPIRVHTPRLSGNILGVITSALFALALWWAKISFEGAPGSVTLVAFGFSALTVILVISLARDASLRLTAYEHGIGWSRAGTSCTVQFDDIADIREVSSTIVIRRRGGDKLAITSNVTERDLLLAHLGLDTPTIPTAKARTRTS